MLSEGPLVSVLLDTGCFSLFRLKHVTKPPILPTFLDEKSPMTWGTMSLYFSQQDSLAITYCQCDCFPLSHSGSPEYRRTSQPSVIWPRGNSRLNTCGQDILHCDWPEVRGPVERVDSFHQDSAPKHMAFQDKDNNEKKEPGSISCTTRRTFQPLTLLCYSTSFFMESLN
jgi:hypothetical protein